MRDISTEKIVSRSEGKSKSEIIKKFQFTRKL